MDQGRGRRISPPLHRPQKVPGFLELVVATGLGIVAATEEQTAASDDGFERDDVPGVFGKDVSSDKVYLSGEIRESAAS